MSSLPFRGPLKSDSLTLFLLTESMTVACCRGKMFYHGFGRTQQHRDRRCSSAQFEGIQFQWSPEVTPCPGRRHLLQRCSPPPASNKADSSEDKNDKMSEISETDTDCGHVSLMWLQPITHGICCALRLTSGYAVVGNCSCRWPHRLPERCHSLNGAQHA